MAIHVSMIVLFNSSLISTLPASLASILQAPFPYLIGMTQKTFDSLEHDDFPAETVVFNIDEVLIYNKPKDVPLLPYSDILIRNIFDTMTRVKGLLSNNITLAFKKELGKLESNAEQLNSLIMEIKSHFMSLFCSLMRDYTEYLKVPSYNFNAEAESDALFDNKGFLEKKNECDRLFHSVFLSSQMFTKFIEERTSTTNESSMLKNDFFVFNLAFFDSELQKLTNDSSRASSKRRTTLMQPASVFKMSSVFESKVREKFDYKRFPLQWDEACFYNLRKQNPLITDKKSNLEALKNMSKTRPRSNTTSSIPFDLISPFKASTDRPRASSFKLQSGRKAIKNESKMVLINDELKGSSTAKTLLRELTVEYFFEMINIWLKLFLENLEQKDEFLELDHPLQEDVQTNALEIITSSECFTFVYDTLHDLMNRFPVMFKSWNVFVRYIYESLLQLCGKLGLPNEAKIVIEELNTKYKQKPSARAYGWVLEASFNSKQRERSVSTSKRQSTSSIIPLKTWYNCLFSHSEDIGDFSDVLMDVECKCPNCSYEMNESDVIESWLIEECDSKLMMHVLCIKCEFLCYPRYSIKTPQAPAELDVSSLPLLERLFAQFFMENCEGENTTEKENFNHSVLKKQKHPFLHPKFVAEEIDYIGKEMSVQKLKEEHPGLLMNVLWICSRLGLPMNMRKPLFINTAFEDVPDDSIIVKVNGLHNLYYGLPHFVCQFPKLEWPREHHIVDQLHEALKVLLLSKNMSQCVKHVLYTRSLNPDCVFIWNNSVFEQIFSVDLDEEAYDEYYVLNEYEKAVCWIDPHLKPFYDEELDRPPRYTQLLVRKMFE
jgi:hypothetical protein